LSPLRGNKNEPANVKIVASYIADLLNTSFDVVSNVTSSNAISLFDLDIKL